MLRNQGVKHDPFLLPAQRLTRFRRRGRTEAALIGFGAVIVVLVILVLVQSMGGPDQQAEYAIDAPMADLEITRAAPPALPASSPAEKSAPPSRVDLSRRESHQLMVKRLAAVAETLEKDGPFEGRGVVEQLQRRVEQLRPVGPSATLFQTLMTLSDESLRIGETETAIAAAESGLRVFEKLERSFPRAGSIRSRVQQAIGVAYMRLAENTNCVLCRNGESCLFPFRGGGVHAQPEPAKQAAGHLRQAIEADPENLTAAWLLNLAMQASGEPVDDLPEALQLSSTGPAADGSAFPEFTNAASELGVDVVDLAGGAIADDFDGDGDVDVLTSTCDPRGAMHLFLNDGAGRFEDASADAGLDGITGGLNMVQADYDNDGDIDVLVLRGGWRDELGRIPNSLLDNDGSGRFVDVSYRVGLAGVDAPTQTAAWQDFDHDGDLDLFVGNEAQPSQLFKQQRDGTFVDVAPQAGVTNDRYAKSVVWGDVDGDSWADLFVSNYGEPNRLYHNRGDGTFEDIGPRLGVTEPIASFPSWFWDYNNDGRLDLFVSSYAYDVEKIAREYLRGVPSGEMDHLYEFDLDSMKAVDVAAERRLSRVTQPMGANFGDVDNDGFLDFYLGTGYPQYEALMPNVMFRNAAGRRFDDIGAAARLGHLQKGHGVAFADFDADGDQDLLHQLGGIYPGDAFSNALFVNPGNSNHWIKIRLIGNESDAFGLGARIRVDVSEAGKTRSIFRWVGSGGSFGGNPLRQEIGLGTATGIDAIEVHWPTTGKTQRLENVDVDQAIEIVEGE